MNSIRRQLTARLFFGFCLLWLAGGGAVFWIVRGQLTREFDQALRAQAQTLVSLTDVNEEGKLELDITGDNAPKHFQVWLPDRSTLRRSGPTDLPHQLGTFDCLVDNSRGRAFGFRFTPRQETGPIVGPELTVVVARPRRELDHLLNLLGAALLAGAVIVPLVAGTLVAITVRRGLLPLNALAERAASIDAQTLGNRFPANLPAELQPIGERLNDLLARLEASFVRERRFSGDVAHELRTPIAELRSLAEVALKWPDEPLPVRDALEIARQMERIVTQLLALARVEVGSQSIGREPIALRLLLEELAGNRARLEVANDCIVQTDRNLLAGVLSNLLDNAEEYTPAAGTIEVRFAGDTLTIANNPVDLSAEDLPHLFERFWRKETARTGGEHAGLGLALAQAYARALGLKLNAELRGQTLLMKLTGLAPPTATSPR
jgi:two-component system sensor histidine kinase QseC